MGKYLEKTGVRVFVVTVFLVIGALFLWRSCTATVAVPSQVYRIARDPTWYPLDLAGKEINMVAFMNELILKIARAQKFRVEFVQAGSKTILSELDAGYYDAVLAPTTPSTIYHDKYLFSDPVYLVGPVMVMRVGEDIKELSAKEGKIVAVQKGNSTVIEDPRRYPQLRVKLYDHMRPAVEDLVRDQVDVVLMDAISAHVFAHGLFAGKIKIVTDPLDDEGIRLIALHNKREEYLIEQFNKGLQEMIGNGTYQRLVNKWNIINTFLETEKLELIDGKLEYNPGS